MPGKLDGKVIAFTGAGRGIGRECAILAAQEGARVVVNDAGVNPDGSGHDAGPAQQVVDEITALGGKAVANTENIATMAGGESVIRSAMGSYGRLDGLVNLAAILRDRMIFNMSEQEWDDVIAVDLKGHFTTCKPASVIFRQQRHGRIVNYSSVSGLNGNPGQANYAAAKAGIAGLTRVLARDLGRYGVTANAIAPGASTRLTATVPESTTALRQRAGIAQPTARGDAAAEMRDPSFVAPMTIYLLLDDAWNINGQIFAVQGGTVSLVQTQYPPARTIWKPGKWTLDELLQFVPSQLMAGWPNPAPPPDDLSVPGRPTPQ